jgi:hypothetical protein
MVNHISGAEFKARTDSLVTVFKARTMSHVITLLSLMTTTILYSGIVNGLQFQSLMINNSWRGYRYSPAPATMDECACSVDFNCQQTRGHFFCNHGHNCTIDTAVWIIPGWFSGCIQLDGVFVTDYRCFYNQTCVNKLLSLYNYDMPDRLPLPNAIVNIPVMNSSVPSRFALNDTLRTIFNELMIEEWTIKGNFDNYYGTCEPATCTYTYAQRLDVVYVVTTIVGLFGGLVVVLRLLSPICVRIVTTTIRLWQT